MDLKQLMERLVFDSECNEKLLCQLDCPDFIINGYCQECASQDIKIGFDISHEEFYLSCAQCETKTYLLDLMELAI